MKEYTCFIQSFCCKILQPGKEVGIGRRKCKLHYPKLYYSWIPGGTRNLDPIWAALWSGCYWAYKVSCSIYLGSMNKPYYSPSWHANALLVKSMNGLNVYWALIKNSDKWLQFYIIYFCKVKSPKNSFNSPDTSQQLLFCFN